MAKEKDDFEGGTDSVEIEVDMGLVADLTVIEEEEKPKAGPVYTRGPGGRLVEVED